MSRIREAVNEQKLQKGPRCGVLLTREQLAPAERDDLDALLNDSSVSGAALARALKSLGHDVGSNTIVRHRRRECSCG